MFDGYDKSFCLIDQLTCLISRECFAGVVGDQADFSSPVQGLA